MNIYHNGKQEDRTPDQQIKGVSTRSNMTDGGQDHNTRYEAPKIEIMKSSWKSRSGKIKTRSVCISYRPVRLRIDQ